MKKFLLILVFFVLAAVVVSAQPLPLNEVITRSARGVEESLPKGTRAAVINFASPSKEFSEYVIEELTSEILEGGKITLVDRSNISRIREELNFQLSGEVSDESALSIGKLLGAQYIITGTVTNMKTFQRFRIRIVNVETAAIQRQITLELKNDAQVSALLNVEEEKTANVRNNWISAALYGFYRLDPIADYPEIGGGVHYERMLNKYFSLGINAYAGGMDARTLFGINGRFQYYPSGNGLFLGASLGYGYTFSFEQGEMHINEYSGRSEYGDYKKEDSGFAFTFELGGKIDAGKPGGFFWQPAIGVRFLNSEKYLIWYIGLGNAF